VVGGLNGEMLHRLIVFLLIVAAGSASAASRPNLVFILADDMGYGDVQRQNPASEIPTPHLDSLMEEGMTFSDAHSPSAVCTPTRYGVLAGRYCWRTRLKRGVLNGYGEPLIERSRVTVADLLQEAGYATAVVGKWHLGLGFARGKGEGEYDYTQPLHDTPNDHGFEHSYIIPASLDFPPYVYIEDREVTQVPSIEESRSAFPDFWRKGPRAPNFVFEEALDHLTDQATQRIRELADGDMPFFLYFPLTAPHKPTTPAPRFCGKTGLGPYGDFILQVDWTVGEVMRAMEDAGIRDETLVIFTSDNGSYMFERTDQESDHVSDPTVQGYHPEHHTPNATWRGTKADIWEAGHRVPFIARWPGVISAGSQCDEPICHVDFFATAAEVAGVALPGPETAPDSFSLVPLFEERGWDRAPVIHHSAGGMFAIREGTWKLVLGNGSGGREKPRGKPFERPYHLFDLSTDEAETRNRIADHPEVAERLENAALRIRDSGRSR